MTKQEIKDAIASKIAGQGNQVDLGNVLPDCLKGIVDLIPDPNIPLKFTAKGAATLGINTNGYKLISDPKLYISDDGKTWEDWDLTDISLADGESIYMKGDNPIGHIFEYKWHSQRYNGSFKITGEIYCEGNIMSLLGETITEIPSVKCFENLFKDCQGLLSAPELPATTLAESCYQGMFQNCTSLVNAPELPATTLAQNCYTSMFEGCISLVNAPELPATILTNDCYRSMFSDCTLISEVTIKATDISATNCLYAWLKNTAASGVIKCNPSMVSTFEADSNTPSGWTVEAIS